MQKVIFFPGRFLAIYPADRVVHVRTWYGNRVRTSDKPWNEQIKLPYHSHLLRWVAVSVSAGIR